MDKCFGFGNGENLHRKSLDFLETVGKLSSNASFLLSVSLCGTHLGQKNFMWIPHEKSLDTLQHYQFHIYFYSDIPKSYHGFSINSGVVVIFFFGCPSHRAFQIHLNTAAHLLTVEIEEESCYIHIYNPGRISYTKNFMTSWYSISHCLL